MYIYNGIPMIKRKQSNGVKFKVVIQYLNSTKQFDLIFACCYEGVLVSANLTMVSIRNWPFLERKNPLVQHLIWFIEQTDRLHARMKANGEFESN